MNRKLIAPIALLTGSLLLASCGTAAATPAALPVVATPTATANPVVVASEAAETAPFTSLSNSQFAPAAVLAENADFTTLAPDEWSETDAVDVDLANPTGSGITSSNGVVMISAGGVYRLTGALAGQILVDAPEDAQVVLILDGVDINNTAGAAIEITSADDVALHLAEGSTNSVTDAVEYAADAEANAAIYSQQDLTISGSGALVVKANGNDGITSKDDLVILDSSITVVATDDALRGKDSLVVAGGTLDLTATGGDGLKSDGDEGDTEIDWTRGYIFITGGEIDIMAGDDGIQAFTDAIIAGGTTTLTAVDDGIKGEVLVSIGELVGSTEPSVTVSNSEEGIEAATIGISAGTITVTANDDGINASGNSELQALIAGTEYVENGQGEFGDTGEVVEISGGQLTVNAEGDGLDSNGSLTISGGVTTVYGPTMGGNGSLDANGELAVTGGTLISFGPGSMEQTPSAGEQGWVLIGAALSAGQTATISDASGNVIGEFTSAKNASTVIYSSPAIVNGQSYSIAVGGEAIGSATAGEGGAGGFGGPEGFGGPGGGQGGPGRP